MAVEANPQYREPSLIFLTAILQQLSSAMQLIFYFKNITGSSASLGRENLKINEQTKRNNHFQFASQVLTIGSYNAKAENQNR